MLNLFAHRRCGILLHPTSLPGPEAQGKLNHEAFHFIDFLQSCSATIWQVLPLGPTHEDGSPYQNYSCFALNPDLLDLNVIRNWNCMPKDKLEKCFKSDSPLKSIYHAFKQYADIKHQTLFTLFNEKHHHWLHDYALYSVLKKRNHHKPWKDWPAPLRDRDAAALYKFSLSENNNIDEIKFEQFLLFSVWQKIKNYAALKHVAIFGDLPIFVSHDSADVWANRSLFDLDTEGNPITVAGVPPDYFSKTGQRWGNPHYRWEEMAKDDYAWWLKRLSHHLELFNLVRIDHFRGLESCWKIPANEDTAINGKWEKVPGRALLKVFTKNFETLPIVAEDLGIITPEVEHLRNQFDLPGMKILQFAFEKNPNNPYLPHNHIQRSVVYTGTHDNDTTLGWFNSLDDPAKLLCLEYLNFPHDPMPWPLIHAALASVARVSIMPMQDILSLGSNARMNIPGTTQGNWRWRFQWSDVPGALPERLHSLNKIYGRDVESWIQK
jgi:4-alpha-glucanotransferase